MKIAITETLPQKFKTLRTIAHDINLIQEEIDADKDRAISVANSLGCNCRLAGQLLIKACEDVQSNLFDDWLASNCPKTSPRHARFYMRLASKPKLDGLEDHTEWRDCHTLLQLDLPEPVSEPNPWPRTPPHYHALQILSRFSDVIKVAPIDHYPKEVVDLYREQLSPICRMLWPDKFKS